MVFFFVYFFQTLFSVFQAIGFPKTGYCGFIVAIFQFDSSAAGIVVGLLLLCVAFCFAVTAAANIMMITKVVFLKSEDVIIYHNNLPFFQNRYTQYTEALVPVWPRRRPNLPQNSCATSMSSKQQLLLSIPLLILSSTIAGIKFNCGIIRWNRMEHVQKKHIAVLEKPCNNTINNNYK